MRPACRQARRRDSKGLVAWIILLAALGLVSCARHHETPDHGFGDIDRWVAVFEDPERDAWQKPDDVVRVLNLKAGDVVADIGAGTGYFTRRFAAAVGPGGKVVGLDIEPAMVRYIKGDAAKRGLANVEARLVRHGDPGLAPGSIDVIFMCDTYHHIGRRVTYLKNVAGALKAEGRVVIVDFIGGPLPIGPPPEHKLAEGTVRKEFGEAGYRLIREHKILPYQYFLEFVAEERS